MDNTGKLLSHGAELTINLRLFESLQIELSGSYQETKDLTDDYKNIVLAYSPNILANLKFDLDLAKYGYLAFTCNYVG